VIAAEIAAVLSGGLLLVLAAYLALPREIRSDPLNPALIMIATVCTLTVGRTAYVLDHGAFFLIFETQFSLVSHARDFALGVFAQLSGVALFVLAIAAVARRLGPARQGSQPTAPRQLDPCVLRIGLFSGALVTTGALIALIGQAGGLHGYIDALRNRQFFFQHEGPLFVALSAFPAAALAWFAVDASPGRSRRWWVRAGGLLGAAALTAIAGGARSPLIFLFLIPVLIVIHMRVRRLSWRTIAVLALVTFLAVSAFRTLARDSGATASRDLYAPGVAGFFTNAFASPDSRLPDSIAVLRANSVPAQNGRTIVGALTAPVPRSVWPGKPRSGNEKLAAALYPGAFKPALGLTLAAEAVWNFGWIGLLLFGAIGAVVGAAYCRAQRRPGEPLRLVLYAAAIGTTLVAARADLFDANLGFLKAFVPALGLIGLSALPWNSLRPRWASRRHVRAGLQYLGMTLAGRGAVFAGLLTAAAVLPVGDYALFALGYQIALFIAYQVAYPFNVAGYRLGAQAHRSAILKRMALVPAIGVALAVPIALALIPSPDAALVTMTAVFAAATSLAVVALGQAQAYGRALGFARWNALGSLGFLALAGLMTTPSGELLAATMGMVVAPAVLLARLGSLRMSEERRPMGRPEPTVFAANLAFSFTFVAFLALVNTRLEGSGADHLALLFTLLQAALMIPLQLVSLVQPRLIAAPSEKLRQAFARTQAVLALTMMLAALLLAAALTLADWASWSVTAPLAASVVPVALGLAGANALLVAAGPGARLLAGPTVFVAALALAALLLGSHPAAAALSLSWLGAALLASLVQALALRRRDHARWLAIGVALGTGCLGLGVLSPVLGALAALAALLAGGRAIRGALLAASEFVAAHR
jgi:hypothetical protein